MHVPRSLFISIPFVILQIKDDSDRQFVTNLYQKYKILMFRTAYSYLQDTHMAEDIVHESCIAIINHLSRVKGIETCKQKAYIVSIVKNQSINYIVKRNRQGRYSFLADDAQLAQIVSTEAETDDHLIRESDISLLKQALLQLPERYQTILRMRYFDELPDREIASYLEVKPNSVRYYLTLARRRLRDQIKKLSEDE